MAQDDRRVGLVAGGRGALGLVMIGALALVTLLPVFPTVAMTRSSGSWPGGDRISWGISLAPLHEVFFWSRSWRGHRMGAFVAVALFDPALAIALSFAVARLVARVSSRARALSFVVPYFAGGFVGACSLASLVSLVRLVTGVTHVRVSATAGASLSAFVIGGALITTALGAYPGRSLLVRAGSTLASIPSAVAGVIALASLLERAGRADVVPNALIAVVGFLLGPLAVLVVRARAPRVC